MINGFHLRRVLRTYPACFASKFLFIRVIRVICVIFSFNIRNRAETSDSRSSFRNPFALCFLCLLTIHRSSLL